jgi:hypothetical protein
MPRGRRVFGPQLPTSRSDLFAIGLAARRPIPEPREGEGWDRSIREFFGGLDEFDDGPALAAYVGRDPRNAALLARYAGMVIARGLDFGTVVEVRSTPIRVWRLVDREPQYRRINQEPVRVRGLPPAEQAAMDRRLAPLAKRDAVAAARHAAKIAGYLGRLLDWLAAKRAPIPPSWCGYYVPPRIAEQWPSITEARGLLGELHRGWSIERQRLWLRLIETEVDGKALSALKAGRAVPDPSPEPEDDYAALTSLGYADGSAR